MHLKDHKIVILHKKTQKTFRKDTKLINMLRQDWVDAGAEVEDLYGTDTFVPADLIIVHVDLFVRNPNPQKLVSLHHQQSDFS
jgi:hypothetical protein